MAEISGAQLLIDSLKREGVDTVYVLPGDPVGNIVNGCAEAGLRVISVRNEQVAAMAAQAHSYLTRSVGVCITASGVAPFQLCEQLEGSPDDRCGKTCEASHLDPVGSVGTPTLESPQEDDILSGLPYRNVHILDTPKKIPQLRQFVIVGSKDHLRPNLFVEVLRHGPGD